MHLPFAFAFVALLLGSSAMMLLLLAAR